jgi:hypothetical protein
LLHFSSGPKTRQAAGFPTARAAPFSDGFLTERRNSLG